MTNQLELVEQKPPRSTARTIAAVVVTVVLLAAAAIVWVLVDGKSGSDGPTPDTSARPAAGTLATGEASADLTSGTKEVAGLPRGFPKSEPGAVEAFTGAVSATYAVATKPERDGDLYFRDLTGKNVPELAKSTESIRSSIGVDSDGTFTGAADRRAYADCLPRFGAYKSSVSSSTSVKVEVWMPCLLGQGAPDDTNDINIYWTRVSGTAVWRGGDWRVPQDDSDVEIGPSPKDKNRPDVSFAERARTLGAGWKLFQGSSEDWPEDLLGQEPGQ